MTGTMTSTPGAARLAAGIGKASPTKFNYTIHM